MKKNVLILLLVFCLAALLLPVTVSAADGTATVTLTVDQDWEDGSGYQLLLDSSATAYGTLIPTSGALAEGDATEELYRAFAYKIPTDAGWTRDTQASVKPGNSLTITIPAGVYDYCIVNPTANQKMWIATNYGSAPGRADNFEFKAGVHYTFTISKFASYDCVNLTTADSVAPTITGLEDGKAYCGAVSFTVSDNDSVSRVTVNGTELLPENGAYTLQPAEGAQTVVAYDAAGNSTTVTVTFGAAHSFGNWQTENGEYWGTCTLCGAVSDKKPVPSLTLTGADQICRTQDYTYTVSCSDPTAALEAGYEFPLIGSDAPVAADGTVVIEAAYYDEAETSMVVSACARLSDGYFFRTDKTVTIGTPHTGELVWTQTASTHEQAWNCCGEIAVASAPHDWKDGICTTCGYVCEHAGGKATCKDKAVCELCGEAYGTLDPNNHADLKHVAAKAATAAAEGNTEYWTCTACGKYYSDAAATKEITKASTVIKKLVVASNTPATGDDAAPALWVVLVLGSAAACAVLTRRKKHSVN